MGRGGSGDTPVGSGGPKRRAAVQKDSTPGPDTPFRSKKEEVDYCRAILETAGVTHGDVAVLNISGEEHAEAIDSFMQAAYDLGAYGVHVVRPLPAQTTEETGELSQVSDLMEAGRGVSISVSSMEGQGATPFEADSDFDKMMNSDPGQDPVLDRRYDQIEAFNATQGQIQAEGRKRWNAAKWPTRQWAEQVFPEIAAEQSPDAALSELVQVLQEAAHSTSPEESEKHKERLNRRAAALSNPDGGNRFQAIEISTPPGDHPEDKGTELRIEIADGASFASCYTETSDGVSMGVNCPTDEVYTTPHKEKVSGHFTTTRPYVTCPRDADGMPVGETVVVEGIRGEFGPDGRLTLTAFNPEHQALLDQDFNDSNDAPTTQLSELGLVDSSGSLARSGRTFYDTILDENTGVHLGFGTSYTVFTGGDESQAAPTSGGNHRDLVVGDERTTVRGITPDGEKSELIAEGAWQDEYSG